MGWGERPSPHLAPWAEIDKLRFELEALKRLRSTDAAFYANLIHRHEMVNDQLKRQVEVLRKERNQALDVCAKTLNENTDLREALERLEESLA